MYPKKRIPKHALLHANYPMSRRRLGRKPMGWTWIALATSIVLAMIVTASFAQADSHKDTPQSGELYFDNATPALLLDTHVDANITGLIANVTYRQSFKNDSDTWQEGIYTFPLPENAAVHRMQMRIGDRIIIGEIKEKQEAKRIYNDAKRQGKRAALTEQQRANMFTQKIANIGPQETVEITLSYAHNVNYDAGTFEWRLPTTFTPRYIPGTALKATSTDCGNNECSDTITAAHIVETTTERTENWLLNDDIGWAAPTESVPDAHRITPPMSIATNSLEAKHFSLTVKLDSGLPLTHIDALYHTIRVRKETDHHRIELKNGRSIMDRDFSLQWRPIASQQPSAALFTETIDGDDYAMLMLLPPQENTANNAKQRIARDIVFIIDTSGSMQGTSITQAKNSLTLALQRLQPEDRFNIVEFNSVHRSLENTLQQATSDNIQHAIKWVNKLQANGGTEMLSALNAAFEHIQGSEQLQQIIFITDGAVGNETQLFKRIHSQLQQARLFTVGIGSAPNSYFMRKAAEFGRGSFTHIGNQQVIGEKMNALFSKLENAVATDIEIQWPDAVEQFPEQISDVYLGEPIIISAKLNKKSTAPVRIRGKLNNTDWEKTLTLPQSREHTSIAKLWARGKIDAIEDQGIKGDKNADQVKEAVTRVALTHQLISRFTSFVAVEQEPARPASKELKKTALTNPIAHGQKQHAIMYPNTATTGEIAWWLGLFFLVSAIVIRRMKDQA